MAWTGKGLGWQCALILLSTPALADSPASAPTPIDLAEAMEGRFATLRDDPVNIFTETRVAFDNPALVEGLAAGADAAALVYSSLLSGPERKPYRRRVTIVMQHGGEISSESFAFTDAMRFAEAMPSAADLAALTPDDLERGIAVTDGATCAMRWTAGALRGEWRGYIAPTDCRLWSDRRGAVIGLEAETRLLPGRIEQTERGFDEAGTQLFGTAEGEFIVQITLDDQL
jgi:hypothetical protein